MTQHLHRAQSPCVLPLTRGNLRLVERLLAQMRRIMDINAATGVTLEVVEAARDRLVNLRGIGKGKCFISFIRNPTSV